MPEAKLTRILSDPDSIAPSLRSQRDAILLMLNSIAANSKGMDLPDEPGVQPFGNLSSIETESVIAILGGRGSGKTTLLFYVCSKLLRDSSDFVLPIIRPERFGKGDTLGGWVLANLQKILNTDFPDILNTQINTTPVSQTLNDWLGQIRRQEALIHNGYGEGLVHQNVTAAEFARDASELNSVGASFAPNWSAFVDALLAHSPRKPGQRDPLMIIPIDDADLRPDLLPALFRELRQLTSHPQVAALFCASEESLEYALLSQFMHGNEDPEVVRGLLEQRLISGEDISDVVHKQLEKAFPSHLRVYLRELGERERLQFTPIDEEEPLIDLLNKVQISGIPYITVLGDFFALDERLGLNKKSDRSTPSLYVQCLAPVPRNLEHLYRRLKQLTTPEDPAPSAAGLALQATITQGIDHVSSRVPATYRDVIIWSQRPDALEMELDLRDMNFGVETGRGTRIRSKVLNGERIVNSVRRLNDFYAASSIRSQLPASPIQRSQETRINRFPAAFCYSLFLANEFTAPFAEDQPVRFTGQFGNVATPGGPTWNATTLLEINSVDIDEGFWLVPDWDSHYDYLLFVGAWNRIVDTSLAMDVETMRGLRADSVFLDWALLHHLLLIAHVQMARKVPRALWDIKPNDLRNLLSESKRVTRIMNSMRHQVEQLFTQLYKKSTSADAYNRDIDFGRWLRVWLPRAATPIAASESIGNWLLDTRAKILEGVPGREGIDSEAANSLASMLSKYANRTWPRLALDVIARLDRGIASQFEKTSRADKAHKEAVQFQMLQALARNGYSEELLRALTNVGMVPELVSLFMEQGLSSEDIQRLTEIFPPQTGHERADEKGSEDKDLRGE